MEPGASRSGSHAVPIGLGIAVLAISSSAAVIRLADPLGPEVVACLRVTVTALGLWLIVKGFRMERHTPMPGTDSVAFGAA